MRVWIDQDLCTGDGICEEICPGIFFGHTDGLYYVKDVEDETGLDANGEPKQQMASAVSVPESLIVATIDAAEECPGECIFIDI